MDSEIISYDKDGNIERFPLFKKFFLPIAIILTATLSFGIGRLSVVGNREPIKIEYNPEISNSLPVPNTQTNQAASAVTATKSDTSVVVSKNGSKYHYPYCPGAKQIKEENKIVFASPTVAEAAGYTLAANCKPR